jgi:protein-S-isoprenylcysteine O-methyltransferase Ste14
MKIWKSYGIITIAGILIVAQYILVFFIYKMPGIPALHWIGWAVWVLSVIFGIVPIIILGKRGGVAKGKSYIKTTRLVDTGLYAIVRHPQYLSGILFSLALMLLAQHWLVILLGVISSVLIWWNIQGVDSECIEKFGQEYQQYIQRVPQINFILGSIRMTRLRQAERNSRKS